ncbi:hypothetical protein AAAT94_01885 [Intestinimonas aquisgranensis]|nr:hypothetical protein [Intestinimonas aquisgranensis]
MDEQELIDTLRRRLDQPGSNITLGRVMVREIIEALLHQQSIIRRLREERRGKGEHHGKDQ